MTHIRRPPTDVVLPGTQPQVPVGHQAEGPQKAQGEQPKQVQAKPTHVHVHLHQNDAFGKVHRHHQVGAKSKTEKAADGEVVFAGTDDDGKLSALADKDSGGQSGRDGQHEESAAGAFGELNHVLENIEKLAGSGNTERLLELHEQLGPEGLERLNDPKQAEAHGIERPSDVSEQQWPQLLRQLIGLVRAVAAAIGHLRGVVRELLSGDLGFTPSKDVHVTMSGLFADVERWPSGIPPGRRPTMNDKWSDSDQSQFFAWLGQGPSAPPELPKEWPEKGAR